MKSKTYIVCWDEVLDNTVHVEDELLSGDFDYLVINKSRLNIDNKNWIKAKDTRYYGHFLTALEDFISASKYSIFIFNAGDARWAEISKYTSRIEMLFEKNPDMGVLSPNQTNDPFTGPGSFIAKSSIEDGLVLSTVTNGIFVAMTRDLAKIMYEYMTWGLRNNLDFYSMTSGWGLDYIYCATSTYLNKYVYKDTSLTMAHPTGSGYNYEVAAKESDQITKGFVKFWAEQGHDARDVEKIFDIFLNKVHNKDKYHVTAEELFVNAESKLVF
jgi:hypothetical protein